MQNSPEPNLHAALDAPQDLQSQNSQSEVITVLFRVAISMAKCNDQNQLGAERLYLSIELSA